MHSHHFLLGFYHHPAILGWCVRFINVENLDTHFQLLFVINEEVQLPFFVDEEVMALNADIQNLELGALVFEVFLLAAVPALNLALWGRWPFFALNKSNAVAAGLLVGLVSCWHLIIIEELHYPNNGLGEIVASFCHVIHEVGLQLV